MNGKIKWAFAQPLVGGLALGFQNAFGTKPSAIITCGFDNDNQYISYMKDVPVIRMDEAYEKFATEEDEKLFNMHCTDLDVFGHLAVCSGLSAMNSSESKDSSKRRGDPNNDQNQNMYNLTKLGMRTNAKVVVFENAPAAYSKAGEPTVNKLREIAEERNYTTQLLKTDTLKHGIPQSRMRTFLMFYNNKNPSYFEFEEKEFKDLISYYKEIPTDAPYQDIYIGDVKTPFYDFVLDYAGKTNFLDAINSLPEIKPKTVTALIAIEAIGFDKAIEWMKDKHGIAYEKALKVLEHAKYKRSIGKNFWDNSSYVPNRGSHSNAVVGKHIHMQIVGEDTINLRQMMHLMGLPHDFTFDKPEKKWNYVCQNVPVCTATYIGNQLKLHLEGKLKESEHSFVKQNNVKQVNEI